MERVDIAAGAFDGDRAIERYRAADIVQAEWFIGTPIPIPLSTAQQIRDFYASGDAYPSSMTAELRP